MSRPQVHSGAANEQARDAPGSARALPVAGKLTRAQAAAPTPTASSSANVQRQASAGASMRAGDWEADNDLLAAMGLALSGDEGTSGSEGATGEFDGLCALPTGPAAHRTNASAKSGTGAQHGTSRLAAPHAPRARPSASATGSTSAPADGSAEMWQHVLGERSSPVGKLARVSAPKGVRLRTGAAANQPDLGILPFDELVSVERRTAHGWCWVVPMGAHAGVAGFCEELFLAIDPPEPTAHLLRVAPGDKLHQLAQRHYGQHLGKGHDARLYVQALVEANRGRKGIFLSDVELSITDRVLRGDDEERTLKTYEGAHVRKGHTLWMPSEAFIGELRKRGAITSGSTELSQAWRGAKDAVGATLDLATYGAAFVVGLLEGSWGAIVDLFQGAAEMIDLVARTAYQVITGNLGAIKDTLMGWVTKLKGAWAGRDKLADGFLRKWEAEDAWTRGNFQGEVLGWVMMTVLLILSTAGSSPLAMAGGKWASVLQALRTVDALGDITMYVGKVARLPGQAASVIRRKLGEGASSAGRVAENTSRTAVKAENALTETVIVSGYAQGPKLTWAKNPDGAVRTIDEAVEIARKNGVEIPDDVLFKKINGKYLPDSTYARYFAHLGMDASKRIRWTEFYDKDLDELLVHVEDSVFKSDEAIVAILAHEMHEINSLRKLFEEAGDSMSARELHYLINPGIKGNLHDRAWEVADKLVSNMRKKAKENP